MNAAGESGKQGNGTEQEQRVDRNVAVMSAASTSCGLAENAQQPVAPSLEDTTASLEAASIIDRKESQSLQPQQKLAAADSTPISVSPPTRSLVVQERENFLVFVKILFKILDDANEPHTKSKAKRIVLECRQRNQQGDPHYHPLMDAIEVRLKRFVGEASWHKAHLLLHHYLTRRRARVNEGVLSAQSMAVVVGGPCERS
jgi:hypothetical protein